MEPDLQSREIVLIESTIQYGRIYFSTADAKFFPADSYGDRKGGGHKGVPITFAGESYIFETYIRISSGQRLSPRKSFAKYLKSVGAIEGGRLRITRIAERAYSLEYLG